jgi:alpha-amylase
MISALNQASLTGDAALVDIALWLSQSDNLHWLQAINATGSEAEASAYFPPVSWRHLGLDQMVWEHQCVYKNFINALDDFR